MKKSKKSAALAVSAARPLPEFKTVALTSLVFQHDRDPGLESDDFKELVASVKKSGVEDPIDVVRQDDGTHLVIAGRRRTEAARIAGLFDIPALVWPYLPDSVEAEGRTLRENYLRKELSPAEKVEKTANIFRRLLEKHLSEGEKEKDARTLAYVQTEAETGMSLSNVQNMVRVWENLSPDSFKAFSERGLIGMKQAFALAKLNHDDQADYIARLRSEAKGEKKPKEKKPKVDEPKADATKADDEEKQTEQDEKEIAEFNRISEAVWNKHGSRYNTEEYRVALSNALTMAESNSAAAAILALLDAMTLCLARKIDLR